jgi:tight adherence protein B
LDVSAVLWLVVALAAGLAGLAAGRTGRSRWRLFSGLGSASARAGLPLAASVVHGRPVLAGRGGPAPAGFVERVGPALAGLVERAGPAVAGLAGAGVGSALGGPVAAGVLAGYGVAAGWFGRRALRRRRQARAYHGAVEAVAAVCADLRAGLAVPTALAAVDPALDTATLAGGDAARVTGRLAAAVSLAESSGAPLADVLDRLDGHLRATDRVRASATAQAAGARASSALLAAMPVAGTGLGSAIGADAWPILLHTPLGAACLAGAGLLQLTGVAWTVRLARVEVSP